MVDIFLAGGFLALYSKIRWMNGHYLFSKQKSNSNVVSCIKNTQTFNLILEIYSMLTKPIIFYLEIIKKIKGAFTSGVYWIFFFFRVISIKHW